MQTGGLPLAPPKALTIVSTLLCDEALQVPTRSASKKLIQETQQGRRPRSGSEFQGSSLRLSTPSTEAPHIPRSASYRPGPSTFVTCMTVRTLCSSLSFCCKTSITFIRILTVENDKSLIQTSLSQNHRHHHRQIKGT